MEGNGQDYLHEASLMQRLAIYATLGLLLSTLGYYWDSWQFWCVLGLFMCSDHLARREGYELGMVFVATLPDAQLNKIRAEVDKILKDKQ